MTSGLHGDPQKTARIFSKLNSVWQFTGAFLAPILFTLLSIQYVTNPALNMWQWLLWLHLPIFMIHEFEEYIFPGGFKNFANTKTILAPKVLKEDTPASEPYIFFINVILVWPWAILGAVFFTIPWIGFSLIIFQFAINNVQHIATFQIKNRGYNPGLFTTMFLLLPYCTLVTWYVIDHSVMTTADWILSFAVCGVVFATLLSITTIKRKAPTNK
jgi:hypothetical protein